jgi:hypothetical protein
VLETIAAQQAALATALLFRSGLLSSKPAYLPPIFGLPQQIAIDWNFLPASSNLSTST